MSRVVKAFCPYCERGPLPANPGPPTMQWVWRVVPCGGRPMTGMQSDGCQHPDYARVYEKYGEEVIGVRCGECGVHL